MSLSVHGLDKMTNYGSVTKEEVADDDGGGRHLERRPSAIASFRDVLRKSLTLSGRSCSVRDVQGTTTIPNQIFNLIKNIVGCGVLALPNGIAAFADAPSAVIPATFYIVLMGSVFGYYFLLIGKTCRMTWTVTFREAWEETIGNEGAVWVTLCNTLKPALGNLGYSMILADTVRALFETMQLSVSRTASLFFITIVVLLPLCMLKNLKVLAPFSIIGTMVFVLVSIVMGVRYFDGTYGRDGFFVEDLPDHLKPSFGTIGLRGAFTPNVLVLVCMLFEAFVAHYNAPRFYTELKDHTIPRFKVVVAYSFGASSVVYILITAFGFLTFGANCDGYILNNYSTKDYLATSCRASIAVAIICTYPVVFIGFRDAVLELLQVPDENQTSGNLNLVSFVLLIVVTLIAMVVEDLGLINAVGGGTLATAIVFVFPTLMYRKAVLRKPFDEEMEEIDGPSDDDKREVKIALALMCAGIVMGVIGVWIAIAQELDTSESESALESNITTAAPLTNY